MFRRIARADATRRTRFHTSRGDFCFAPAYMGYALATTLRRHLTGTLPHLPWLTLPAIRHVRSILRGKTLFEFGSGTSTLWYSERCTRVIAVEHDHAWFERNRTILDLHPNCKLLHREGEDYVNAIREYGRGSEVVVIDGLRRAECLQAAIDVVGPSASFIIDNTDVHPDLEAALRAEFTSSRIHRFSGWVPGIFHPSETTVISSE